MTDTEATAWDVLWGLIEAAPFDVEVIPPSDRAEKDTDALGLVSGSLLGSIILNTGGLILDHGWLRLLGSNSVRMGRSLRDWNERLGLRGEGMLVIGDDALGGFFALNGGLLPGERGEAFYFAPDTLAFEAMGCGHSALVQFLLGPGMASFYEEQRWAGWEAETQRLAGDRAIFVHPPVFAEGPPIAERRRGAVPLSEIITLHRQNLAEFSPGLLPIFPEYIRD